jgi:centrosome and spindle pole-associated protein 1
MIKWEKNEEEVEKKPRSSLKEILDQQVRERRERKDKENREREKFIKKMESDEYDPWGRPGGGAPLTDSSGKLITERGMMRKSFDGTSPRLSEEEKKRIQQQKQKEELTLQIKEKEEKKLKEKLVQQQTDEYEEERIRREVENLRMQSLKEKEMEKENKEKKVEVSPRPPSGTAGMSKQEIVEMQIKMEMENKKRKQKEEDERLQRLAEKMASNTRPDYNRRNPSPPLPALQKANDSPPVPALRETQPALSDALYTTRPLTTTKSNVILNPPPQLTSVNEAISISSVEPVQLTGSASYTIPVNPVSQTTNSLPQSPEVMRLPPPDIDKASSEVSLMGNLSALKKQLRRNLTPQSTHSNPPIKLRPSIPKRREQSKPSTRFNDTIDTFNSIKYSNPTNSRLSFLKEYPVPPTTLSSLEIQQDALLEHQKQRNAQVSDGWSLPRPPSGQSLITVNTMDIDGLAARNQERAKRLEAILNARQVDQDQSQQDHRGILTSFMEGLDRKHRHRVDHVNSETSLDCDTVFHPLN